jgi:hypothetical protein
MKILAIAFLTALNLFAVDHTSVLPVSLSEQFVFEPGGLVEVRGNFTDLVVEGWDHPDIEVTMTWRDPGLCCAGTLDESVGYDARKKETDHFVISAEEPLPGPSRFRIRVPKESRLVIHEPHKRLSISGVRGEIHVSLSQKGRTGNNGHGREMSFRGSGNVRTASAKARVARTGCPTLGNDSRNVRTSRYAEI